MNCLRGLPLITRGGKYGKCRDLYFDDKTWRLRYLAADNGALLFRKSFLLAPESIERSELEARVKEIPLNVGKEQIKSAPVIDSDVPVSRQKEQELFAHYNWLPYWLPHPPEEKGAIAEAPVTPPSAEIKEGNPNLRSLGEVIGYQALDTTSDLGTLIDLILDVRDFSIPHLVIDTRPRQPGGVRWLSTALADNKIEFDFEKMEVHSKHSVYHLLENPAEDSSGGRLTLDDQKRMGLPGN